MIVRTNTVRCQWKMMKEGAHAEALHHLEHCLQAPMNYTLFCVTTIDFAVHNIIVYGTVINICTAVVQDISETVNLVNIVVTN